MKLFSLRTSRLRQPGEAEKPRKHLRRLLVQRLECRRLLAVISEVEPNDTVDQYQPLNESEAYEISGRFDANTDFLDYYSFYARAGQQVTVEANLDAGESVGAAIRELTALDANGTKVAATSGKPSPGAWHGELSFIPAKDGALVIGFTRFYIFSPEDISPAPVDNYNLNIRGAARPFMKLVSEFENLEAFITPVPEMPKIRWEVAGLVPHPSVDAMVNWKTVVKSMPGDFPHQIRIYESLPVAGTSKLGAKDPYEVNFSLPVQQIVGGKVATEAKVTIQGKEFVLKSNTKPNTGYPDYQEFKVLGRSPEATAIDQYLQTLTSPADFPSFNAITFGSLMVAIREQETGSAQFLPSGAPHFNVGTARFPDDGGVGIWQISNPLPTTADVWDWKANTRSAVSIFGDKLESARGWIDGRAYKSQVDKIVKDRRLPASTPVVIRTSGLSRDEMILRDAVQLYNGGHAFIATVEFQSLSNGASQIAVTWKRTAADYHQDVLGRLGVSEPLLSHIRHDIDGNGTVLPLDALLIINQLVRQSRETAPYNIAFDVNLDGSVNPLDALIVINWIGRGQRGPQADVQIELSNDSGTRGDSISNDFGLDIAVSQSSLLFLSRNDSDFLDVSDRLDENGILSLSAMNIDMLFGPTADGEIVFRARTSSVVPIFETTVIVDRVNPQDLQVSVDEMANGNVTVKWSSSLGAVYYAVFDNGFIIGDETLDTMQSLQLSTGLHELHVEAYDLAGNFTRSTSVTISV